MGTEWTSEDTPEFVTRISVGAVRVRELPTIRTELPLQSGGHWCAVQMLPHEATGIYL